MARTLAAIFLLAFVITSLEILFADGRPIKAGNDNTINLHQTNSHIPNVRHQSLASGFFGDSAVASKDDFRPTSPGYSPGVGHHKTTLSTASSVKQSLSGKEQMPPPVAKGSGFFGDSAAASKNDFRPTSPGYSPGVGHPKTTLATTSNAEQSLAGKEQMSSPVTKASNFFDDSAAASKDDFQPTPPEFNLNVGGPETPATSFNIEQSSAAAKDEIVVRPRGDAFRPTPPGHSPGVGHFKAVVADPFAAESVKDDYRPTQPGHSPGVGHAHAFEEPSP